MFVFLVKFLALLLEIAWTRILKNSQMTVEKLRHHIGTEIFRT